MNNMQLENQSGWRLKSIRIAYQDWGEHKGKYTGEIIFGNKQSEAFTFNISDDKAAQFLALIKENIVDSAKHLGDRLLQSLGELPAPEKRAAIDDISHEQV